jgi:hypothetical protein
MIRYGSQAPAEVGVYLPQPYFSVLGRTGTVKEIDRGRGIAGIRWKECMDVSLGWRARHEELEERVRSAGTLLADREMPAPERDEISQEFIDAWQQFTKNMKQMPVSRITR